MKRMKMRAMLALSVALSVAGITNAGVIEKVPSDAVVVVKLSNLAETSTKIGKLATKLGITMFVPKAADPLTALKEEMNITAGVKDDGEMAIVLLDPKGSNPDDSTLVLIPTSDYKALVSNLEGATTEGNLTVFTKDDKTIYIADWNGYAAGSSNKDLVSAAPSKVLDVTDRAAKELASNDLVLYANINALREPLTAELTKGREKGRAEFENELKDNGQVEEKYHPAALAAFDQVINAAEAFVRDADAATVSLTLTEDGVKQSVVTEFKPGSYLGNFADSLESTEEPLLSNLPAAGYLFYSGFKNSPAALTKLIDDLAGPVVAKLPADDETAKLVPTYIDDVKGLLSHIKGGSSAMLAPKGTIGQDPLIQVLNVLQSDSGSFQSDLKAFNDKYSEVTQELMAAGNGGMKVSQTYTAAAKTIDGVSFDLMSSELTGDGGEVQQAKQMFQFMYGGEKIEQYVGTVGNKVLTFMGASDDSVKALVAAAKAGDAPLAALETVKATSSALPKKRIAEVYIAADEIFATAVNAAAQFGQPINVGLPPDLQPIGIAFTSDAASLEATSYISSDLLQALVSAGMQIGMQMQGGGGGANNGGL